MATAISIPAATVREPPFALLLIVVWLLAMVQLLAQGWALTAHTLPDADDAMRLVEVREFLSGRGWFDLHELRLAPPIGYDTHWSRLIDAGLAGMILGLRTVVAPEMAERLAVVLWPMLWLLPTIGGVAAIAWRLAGREAALAVLLLAVFSMPGFQQFRPGRIDHHNVHLTLSVLVVAAAAWTDRKRWCGWAAGLLTGLALAIGFESLPFVMLAGAAFALRFVFDRVAAASLRAYSLAALASTAAAFFVSVPPARWAQSVCDGIALNSTSAVVIAMAGLALAATVAPDDWRKRMLAIAGAGAVALAVFVAFEPRCLGGPYALVDPAIGPVWLDHVAEVQTLARMMHESAVNGWATVIFPLVALVALLLSATRRDPWKEAGAWVAAAAFVIAFAMVIAAIKEFSYAMWFGLPFVAAAILDLTRRLRVTSLAGRCAAILVLTPTALTVGAIVAATAAGSEPLVLDTAERQACVSRDSAAALAQLPRGLIVTNELEWAPYLLAWTPHSLVAAPYHRLSKLIVNAHHMLSLPPDDAHRLIDGAQVTYVVTCGSRGPLGMSDAALAQSLWGRLRAGDVPSWLAPVPMPAGQPFTVYRVAS